MIPSGAVGADSTPAALTDPDALLDRAEALYADGKLADAREALAAALELAGERSPARVRALGDLAVVDATDGDLDAAALVAGRAVSIDAGHTPALEVLAHCARERGDLVEAAHWLRHAAEASGEAAPWCELAELLLERADLPGAREALGHAATIDRAGAEALFGELERREALRRPVAVSARPVTGRSALIVVDFFHPSVGGSERVSEDAGVALQKLGWSVEVATRMLPERDTLKHRGMTIHQVSGDPLGTLSELVRSRGYDAVLAISDPLSWPVPAALALAEPRPRVVAVPCVNAQNYAVLGANPPARERHRALAARADALVYSSFAGYDARLCDELGLPAVYVPNAVGEPAAEGEFARLLGLDPELPLLLAVGNRYPEKNHVGLLEALREHPGDWQLAIVGRPTAGHEELSGRIEALAAQDPRVTLVPGAPAATVATAMAEADALLLPSLAEATPLVLLEAMRARLPWIATPTCGSAHDHAGGLIVPLDRFGRAVSFVTDEPEACSALGDAGRAHYEGAYNWDVVGARYAALMAGTGEPGPLGPPAGVLAATDTVRARFYDASALGASR